MRGSEKCGKGAAGGVGPAFPEVTGVRSRGTGYGGPMELGGCYRCGGMDERCSERSTKGSFRWCDEDVRWDGV